MRMSRGRGSRRKVRYLRRAKVSFVSSPLVFRLSVSYSLRALRLTACLLVMHPRKPPHQPAAREAEEGPEEHPDCSPECLARELDSHISPFPVREIGSPMKSVGTLTNVCFFQLEEGDKNQNQNQKIFEAGRLSSREGRNLGYNKYATLRNGPEFGNWGLVQCWQTQKIPQWENLGEDYGQYHCRVRPSLNRVGRRAPLTVREDACTHPQTHYLSLGSRLTEETLPSWRPLAQLG